MTPASGATAAASFLRPQILARRARLQAAAAAVSAEYIHELLDEVDAALQRIDRGSYGLCEVCHDTIEAERLQANPMVRFCLEHLSGRELEAHQQDLDLATRIQTRLLPPCDLHQEHWDTHYRYEPAGPVGGDYCEVMVPEKGGPLFFAVGDVSGKGVAASLLMTHLSAILRSLLSLNVPLVDLMARANRLFCESTLSSQYATLVCGRTTDDGVELCNAGHCAPLALRGGGVERLDSAGLPLGLFCGGQYAATHVGLATGESLILYSDGLSETEDPEGGEFGEAGLMRSLESRFGDNAETVAHGVMDDVKRFRAGKRPADDLTLLVVRRR